MSNKPINLMQRMNSIASYIQQNIKVLGVDAASSHVRATTAYPTYTGVKQFLMARAVPRNTPIHLTCFNEAPRTKKLKQKLIIPFDQNGEIPLPNLGNINNNNVIASLQFKWIVLTNTKYFL